jgi:hypothetical protein
MGAFFIVGLAGDVLRLIEPRSGETRRFFVGAPPFDPRFGCITRTIIAEERFWRCRTVADF